MALYAMWYHLCLSLSCSALTISRWKGSKVLGSSGGLLCSLYTSPECATGLCLSQVKVLQGGVETWFVCWNCRISSACSQRERNELLLMLVAVNGLLETRWKRENATHKGYENNINGLALAQTISIFVHKRQRKQLKPIRRQLAQTHKVWFLLRASLLNHERWLKTTQNRKWRRFEPISVAHSPYLLNAGIENTTLCSVPNQKSRSFDRHHRAWVAQFKGSDIQPWSVSFSSMTDGWYGWVI